MERRNARHRGVGQGDPATGVDPVAEFDAVVPIAEGHRQVPLGGMAIDRHFLQGVRVHATVAHAGDVGHAQAELVGTVLERLLAIRF